MTRIPALAALLIGCGYPGYIRDLEGCTSPDIGIGELGEGSEIESAACAATPPECGNLYNGPPAEACKESLCEDEETLEATTFVRAFDDGGGIIVLTCR